jgi:hypothetical protein
MGIRSVGVVCERCFEHRYKVSMTNFKQIGFSKCSESKPVMMVSATCFFDIVLAKRITMQNSVAETRLNKKNAKLNIMYCNIDTTPCKQHYS